MNFKFYIYVIFLTSLLPFSTLSLAKQPHITFSTFTSTNHSVLGKICELTFTEAFRRLGMTFSVVVLPVKRSAIEIDGGYVDGDLGRPIGYSDNFPNIIRMNVSFVSAKMVVFTIRKNIKINSPNDLRNSGFTVGYLNGSSIVENLLKGKILKNNFSPVNNRSSGLHMLARGRIDMYIDGELDIVKLLQDPLLKNSGIYIAGTIAVIPLYPFINKKHKDLIPKLVHVIQEMKSQGLIKKYTKIALSNKNSTPSL